MHSLIGTFLNELLPIKYKDFELYPVKIVLPPNKVRIIFFAEK